MYFPILSTPRSKWLIAGFSSASEAVRPKNVLFTCLYDEGFHLTAAHERGRVDEFIDAFLHGEAFAGKNGLVQFERLSIE